MAQMRFDRRSHNITSEHHSTHLVVDLFALGPPHRVHIKSQLCQWKAPCDYAAPSSDQFTNGEIGAQMEALICRRLNR